MKELSPDQTSEGWSKIVPGYEGAFEKLTSHYAHDVMRLLDVRSGERVIDVAAGTGAFSLLAAHHGAEVLATDFAPGMISRLREHIATLNLSHITAEIMDGQALTVPSGSADISLSVLGLIFFPDIRKGMTELRRVLRPGGRSAVVCWSDLEKFNLIKHLDKAISTVVPEFKPTAPPVWTRLLGATALQAEMEAAGFKRVETTLLTRSIPLPSPKAFWSDFATSAPPLAFLFEKLGPEITAKVGETLVELLLAEAGDGVPEIWAEVCIGIGWA